MLIHIAVTNSAPKSLVRRDEILDLHARSNSGSHHLTDDPEQAEFILLAGDMESLAQAQANPLLRRYPEKTFTYSEIDTLIPYVPGVYASAVKPRLLSLRRTQSNIYVSRFGSSMNVEVRQLPPRPKNLLFCFQGRKDCRVRKNILSFPYHRSDILVLESSGFMHWDQGIIGDRRAQRGYVDAINRSHFALCPRGMGVGSIRLFEVMEMGVAPVLLADRYALPPGPDWKKFLLQVPERDFARLPGLLEAHQAESEERGQLARRAWESFFAPEVVFDRLVDQICTIRQQRVIPEKVFRQIWPVLAMTPRTKAWLLGAVHKAAKTFRHPSGASGHNQPAEAQTRDSLDR